MEPALPAPAVAADAAAVTEVVVALERSLYGQTAFTQADLEDEWSAMDLEQDARVVRTGDRIVGYGAVRERGELWRAEGYVHPDALGRGIGKLIATGIEEDAARHGARRIQNGVFEADPAARSLLESLGYDAVRVFRELRIELQAPPPAALWPDGLRVVPFDSQHDALEFHAAHQEAFADHWEYTPRDFEAWSKDHLESERFDPTLWCVVRARAEIAAGAICTGDTYGGGWVHALFTRRGRVARRSSGLVRALLGGEHSVGLGVDAASDTGAFRLYERAGMAPVLGWVMYEKAQACAERRGCRTSGIIGDVRLGIADHLGWAVAVAATDDHAVVDRRKLELIEPGLSAAPIHYESSRLSVPATAALVAKVRASVVRASSAALDELASALPAPVRSISLRAWPLDFPDDIAVQRRAPYEARADAIMYRQELSELAQARDWEVHLYDAKAVVGQAVSMLAERADDVLHGPRATLGPPWTNDHRVALAATIVAG